jgi:hypothetical protein
MFEDLAGTLRAIAVFPLFILAPGYVAAWALDLFGFRGRRLSFRLAFSLVLSISICPILTYLTGRYVSLSAASSLFVAAAAMVAALLVRERVWRPIRLRVRLRSTVWFAAIFGLWLVVSLASLIDLQIGDRLYYPASAIDYSLRTAFVHSISTTGVPPASPLFVPGHPVLLRYHYFWLLMCSLAERAGGTAISARQAMIGGTFWAGLGVVALLAVYLRLMAPGRIARLRRRILTGISLLAITGLDILPALFFLFLYARRSIPFTLPSVEWWNEHVDWFVYTTLWAPHALASMVACFTGFVLLWYSGENRRHIAPAALALASAVGASIYVAFPFAIFLVIWTAISLWKRWYRDVFSLCATGLVAVVLAFPYLRDLAGTGSGGALFQLSVRDFSLAALVPTGSLAASWRRILVNLPLLPLNYLLEFGLFFLVARYKWLQHRKGGLPLSRLDLAMAAMAMTSTLVCTFLRSSVIGCNDLGWRGFLIAEFVLLFWAVDLFGERERLAFLTPMQKQLFAVFFALGFAGTVCDLVLVRFYPVLADRGVAAPIDWMSPDRDLGHRTYAVRSAYQWLRNATTETAAVQASPRVIHHDVFGLIYGGRHTVAGDLTCHTVFGGDPRECAPIAARVAAIFPVAGASAPTNIQEACGALPIDSLVARDTDPVWKNRQSWVWTERPAYSNNYVRIFRCEPRVAVLEPNGR